MSESIFLAIVYAVVSVIAFVALCRVHQFLSRDRITIAKRLAELEDSSLVDHSPSLFVEGAGPRRDSSYRARFEYELLKLIERAGMSCTLNRLVSTSVACGVVASLVAWNFSAMAAIAAFVLALPIPVGVIYARRHSRKRELIKQLPEVFQTISRAIRSGQTLPAALKMIAEDFQSPVKDEFSLCYEQQAFGMSRESSLRKLANRTQIMELQIFVLALLVQTRSGGDLVELLDNLASIMQKRLRLRDRILSLTGEGRMQAVTLIVLPFVAYAALLIASPDYAATLMERPHLLFVTALSQLIGAIWIYRIINFEF